MDNNPLKKYFRKPAVYIKLPSEGKRYTPDVFVMPPSGELAVYPMTALDEITAKTPDALFNGEAMTSIIKSCVPDIKDPWRLSSSDFDAVLIAIRAASNQSTYNIISKCPNCSEENEFGINLIPVLSQLKEASYDQEFQFGDLHVKYRPLIYKEMNDASISQVAINKELNAVNDDEKMPEEQKLKALEKAVRNVTEHTMRIIAAAIEHIRIPDSVVKDKRLILEFLKNCDNGLYTQIRDKSIELKNATEIKPVPITCPDCKHEYEQKYGLDLSSFFA